jgi:hypothetical protein
MLKESTMSDAAIVVDNGHQVGSRLANLPEGSSTCCPPCGFSPSGEACVGEPVAQNPLHPMSWQKIAGLRRNLRSSLNGVATRLCGFILGAPR